MIRIIALLLQALVAFAVTVGALSRPEALGSHLAGSGAPRCERGHGAAYGVVGAHVRRSGGSVLGTPTPSPSHGGANQRCVTQAQLESLNRPPSPRLSSRMRRRGVAVDRTPPRVRDHDARDQSRVESGARGKIVSGAVDVELRVRGGDRYPPHASRETERGVLVVAEAGCAGVPFRSPSTPLGRLAITLSNGVRARLHGPRPAVATTAESAPKPPMDGNGNVNAGGLPRTFRLGTPGRSGDIRPHWRGRPWGFASRRPFSGDSLGTSWGHPRRVARNVRFPDKWDNALLAIAKGVMP
jgi:hypothetical protein